MDDDIPIASEKVLKGLDRISKFSNKKEPNNPKVNKNGN